MSTKHTSGPYTKVAGPTPTTTYIFALGNQLVATAVERDRSDGANANLFVAAPDLLAACKATVQAYESRQLYDKCPVGLLRLAIAKAEPEES